MDLSFLRFATRPGPWASVYLDASRATEEAITAIPLRWRGLRTALAEQGTDQPTLDALEQTLLGADCGGHCGLAGFARAGRVEYALPLPAPPIRDLATVGPVPDVRPMLVACGEPVAWVRAVVDHTGGEVAAAPAWPDNGLASRHVEGHEHYPIHKAAPGGWSQARYQRAAEVTWERNAVDVTAALAAAAERTHADVVVVAGDVRSRRYLIEHVPQRWRPRVVEVETGSRAAGAKHEHLEQATRAAVDRVVAERIAAAWAAYREGDGARARAGLSAVVEAVREGRVQTLLLTNDGLAGELWVGPEATDLAVRPAELSTASVWPARADAAVLRALAGTGGDVLFVSDADLPEGADLPDGIGAVLRGFAAAAPG